MTGGFAAPAAPQLRAPRVGLGIPRQHARVACRTAETYLGENNKQISFSCLCEAWLGARKAKMEQEARARVFLSPLWKELIRVSEFPFAISTAGCQLIAHLLWERPAGKRHTAGSSYLPPSQTLLSVSQVQWPPPQLGHKLGGTRRWAAGEGSPARMDLAGLLGCLSTEGGLRARGDTTGHSAWYVRTHLGLCHPQG